MASADPFAAFKTAQRAGWEHFAPLQAFTTVPAARLVDYAGIGPGHRVLDVACGTGVVAVTAARRGAMVTGLDLTPALLEVARENGRLAGVPIAWHEGDVEALPFADASFDAVLSQYGHIFAPRPDLAVREMLRVLKPGGVIAFSTWPPELYVGRMFALTASYLPAPPPGVAPPTAWGDPRVVRERLEPEVRDLRFDRGTLEAPALSPRHYREMFERTAGPLINLVATLRESDPAKLDEFRHAAEALVAEYFHDNVVRQGYLLTRAVKI